MATKRRKIIAYLATSADGFIARPDGDVEWLERRPQAGDYGMTKFYRSIDTILWGRKTYDWAVNYYRRKRLRGSAFDPSVNHYAFSHRPPKRPAAGVTFVKSSIKVFAKRLRATPGKDIWMMGGGGLIASFLDAGELDELDLHVIPVMIGDGIPLAATRRRDVSLKLIATQKYSDGVVRLRYTVQKRRRK